MTNEARWRAERELQAGERLLWSGRGGRSWRQWLPMIALVAFGLPLRIAAGISNRHPETNASAVVVIHRLEPWLWAGFALAAILLFVERRKLADCYAVTNRRLLFIRRRTRSYPVRSVGRAVKAERRGGGGDLTFPDLGPLIGFYGLDDVRDAERAVVFAAASSPADGPPGRGNASA